MLTEEVEALYDQINRIAIGDNLHHLKATTYTLGLAAAVKELKSPVAPLLIALSAAAIGNSQGDSKYGVLPTSLTNAANCLSDGLNSQMAKTTAGRKRLLRVVMNFVFTLAVVLPVGLKASQGGLLNFDLLLQAILSSGIMKAVLENISELCGATERSKESLAQIVILALLLVMIFTTSTQSKKSAETIIESHSIRLISLIENAESTLGEIIRGQGVSNIFAGDINIALHQGRMLLTSNKYEEFLNLLSSLEEKFKVNEDDKSLKQCMKEVQNLSSLLWSQVLATPEDFSADTAIVQG